MTFGRKCRAGFHATLFAIRGPVQAHGFHRAKNPKPCEIDTYLSYPDMDRDCHCPIWHFEESMVKDDAEA